MKVRFSLPQPPPPAFETKIGSKARRAENDQILKEYIPKEWKKVEISKGKLSPRLKNLKEKTQYCKVPKREQTDPGNSLELS